jgi:acid stress-induced BolA-like protein IbaG/YrbA
MGWGFGVRDGLHSGKLRALFTYRYIMSAFVVGIAGLTFLSSNTMQAEQIKALIESQIPDCDVKSVDVMGDHIGLVVVSPAFAGLTPVKKQQLVLSTLSAQFADRSIHAVDYIKSFTPEQWQQQQQQ